MFTLFLDSGTQVVFRGSLHFCFSLLKDTFGKQPFFKQVT